MKKLLLSFLLILGFLGFSHQSAWADKKETKPQKKIAPKPLIQIAILLDTSNSMDGLIDQAKSQLWKIVNAMATTRRNGQTPDLQVAIFEYGKSSISAEQGYLQRILPLSDDLDKVSAQLFALKTYGGYEFCGRVIQSAVNGLNWSKSNRDYKAIFIAGNEPFTQGNVDYRIACKAAIAQGIIVNTIFCGPRQVGIATKWKDGAKLADGQYMNIDQNQKVVHIPSPYDKKITHLGRKLNQTYIPFGRQGMRGKNLQEKEDRNAAKKSKSGASLQRAIAKSNSFYKANSWDLVDAIKSGKIKLEQIKKSDLPRAMQEMTLEQKKAYLAQMAQDRQALKKEIKQLNQKRQKYVAAKRREKGSANTLDKVMINTIKGQLKKKNFKTK